jgi:hypothetical protein
MGSDAVLTAIPKNGGHGGHRQRDYRFSERLLYNGG